MVEDTTNRVYANQERKRPPGGEREEEREGWEREKERERGKRRREKLSRSKSVSCAGFELNKQECNELLFILLFLTEEKNTRERERERGRET